MKEFIIIAVCLSLALILRIAEVLINRKTKNNVKIDIHNPESVAEGIAHYKQFDD